jgi:hypothetical protein
MMKHYKMFHLRTYSWPRWPRWPHFIFFFKFTKDDTPILTAEVVSNDE